jgi:hypothetical protein
LSVFFDPFGASYLEKPGARHRVSLLQDTDFVMNFLCVVAVILLSIFVAAQAYVFVPILI